MEFANRSIRSTYFMHLEKIKMSEENETGSNLIWALTTIIVVAMIVGALYYSGFLSGKKKQEIDVQITAPAR